MQNNSGPSNALDPNSDAVLNEVLINRSALRQTTSGQPPEVNIFQLLKNLN